MKNNTYKPQALKLTQGHFSSQSYDSYETLRQQDAKTLIQGCPYQFQSTGLSGRYQLLQLLSMQITYAAQEGAAMHTVFSTKDCLSIAVIKSCTSKACLDQMKFEGGEIFFLDDDHLYNWATDAAIEYAIITIRKSALPPELSHLSKIIDHNILDTDAHLITTLYKIRKNIINDPHNKKNTKYYQEMEHKILTILLELLAEQTPIVPKLTLGEKVALKIRDRVFGHMDWKVSISSLAKEYQISEQTLQNSFKSLFGFGPKQYLRLLKLNLAHQELIQSNPDENSVSKIAIKWGFGHMGRFTAYHTELFGENPSKTLKASYGLEENMEAVA